MGGTSKLSLRKTSAALGVGDRGGEGKGDLVFGVGAVVGVGVDAGLSTVALGVAVNGVNAGAEPGWHEATKVERRKADNNSASTNTNLFIAFPFETGNLI